MPVLHRLGAERLSDGALRGRRIAVVVHLEAKTACLVLALREAGASVVAAGSNPLSTQDAVCAALVERGVEVFARHGVAADEFTADLLAVAEAAPERVIDHGAELTRRSAPPRPRPYASHGRAGGAGGGQVAMGSPAMEPNGRKVRRSVEDGHVIAGFAGAAAGAFAGVERLERQVEEDRGQVRRGAVELA